MAKKSKGKKKKLAVAGISLPKPIAKAVWSFLDTPLGREVAAEALTHAARTLVRKHPVAAGATATAGVGAAAKVIGGHAVGKAAKLLHSASDRLRAGFGDNDDLHRRRRDDEDEADFIPAGERGSVENRVYPLEEALFGDLKARKKWRKLAKQARSA